MVNPKSNQTQICKPTVYINAYIKIAFTRERKRESEGGRESTTSMAQTQLLLRPKIASPPCTQMHAYIKIIYNRERERVDDFNKLNCCHHKPITNAIG